MEAIIEKDYKGVMVEMLSRKRSASVTQRLRRRLFLDIYLNTP